MIRDLYLNDDGGLELGVWLERAPALVSPRERGEWIEIAGRHGEAWRGDNAYEGFNVSAEIYVPETCDLGEVIAWLRGAERLRWGDNDWEYRVSAADTQIELRDWEDFIEAGKLATVSWHAEPFRYLWPAPEAIECQNPQVINNPCGADAAPLITLVGSGAVNLSIGGYLVSVDDLAGGLVMDCETQMAWNLARTAAATQGITLVGTDAGRWPRLAPGPNAVAWTGSCAVTVLPRWRER